MFDACLMTIFSEIQKQQRTIENESVSLTIRCLPYLNLYLYFIKRLRVNLSNFLEIPPLSSIFSK